MKVVDISEFRKNKIKSEKTAVKIESPPIDSSYHFSSISVRVDFGGAFVRSLIENLEENREKVLKSLEISHYGSIHVLESMLDKEDEKYKALIEALNKQRVLTQSIVDEMKTPEDFDEMFQEGSKYLNVIGYVITIIMAHSYSQFDYYKMKKDNWLQLSTSVEEFINLPFYKEVVASGSL